MIKEALAADQVIKGLRSFYFKQQTVQLWLHYRCHLQYITYVV